MSPSQIPQDFHPRFLLEKIYLIFLIMNGFETITRLGGYILLFSILAGCIRYYAPFPLLYQYLLLGFTEITSGLSLISVSGLPYMTRILLSAAAPHPAVCASLLRQKVFSTMTSAFCLILFPSVSVHSLQQVFFTV